MFTMFGESANEGRVGDVIKIKRPQPKMELISFIFEDAQKRSKHSRLCYINSDIIVLNSFLEKTNHFIRT